MIHRFGRCYMASCLLAISALFSQAAHATKYTVTYQGSISSVSEDADVVDGSVAPGTPFTYKWAFDTEAVVVADIVHDDFRAVLYGDYSPDTTTRLDVGNYSINFSTRSPQFYNRLDKYDGVVGLVQDSVTAQAATPYPIGNYSNLFVNAQASLYQDSGNLYTSIAQAPTTDFLLPNYSGAQLALLFVNAEDSGSSTLAVVRGNIDRVTVESEPSIIIKSPTETSYVLGEKVLADYSCGAIGSCLGTTPNGQPIDTSSVGQKVFTVTKISEATPVSKTVLYAVTYKTLIAQQSASITTTNPVLNAKVILLNAQNRNVSNARTVLTATKITNLDTGASSTLPDQQKPRFSGQFRYTANGRLSGFYQLSLKLKGFSKGNYRIDYIATNDPVPHSLFFQIR